MKGYNAQYKNLVEDLQKANKGKDNQIRLFKKALNTRIKQHNSESAERQKAQLDSAKNSDGNSVDKVKSEIFQQ